MAVLLGSIKITKPRGNVISLDQAKKIASYWHGGQWSPLYSFLSSYKRGTRFAWTAAIDEVDLNLKNKNKLLTSDIKQLNSLKKFFQYKRWEENN